MTESCWFFVGWWFIEQLTMITMISGRLLHHWRKHDITFVYGWRHNWGDVLGTYSLHFDSALSSLMICIESSCLHIMQACYLIWIRFEFVVLGWCLLSIQIIHPSIRIRTISRYDIIRFLHGWRTLMWIEFATWLII